MDDLIERANDWADACASAGLKGNRREMDLANLISELTIRIERMDRITADDVFSAYVHANNWVESEFEAIARWVRSVAAGGPIRPSEWGDEEQDA